MPLPPTINAQIVIGFRPEALEIVEPGDNTIPIKIEVVEELGSDSYISATSTAAAISAPAPTQIPTRRAPTRLLFARNPTLPRQSVPSSTCASNPVANTISPRRPGFGCLTNLRLYTLIDAAPPESPLLFAASIRTSLNRQVIFDEFQQLVTRSGFGFGKDPVPLLNRRPQIFRSSTECPRHRWRPSKTHTGGGCSRR